ncbi:MAG: pyridoxal-phosphate-dependent aminotransferase family protein [Deltaproteobacteria bacterium]
MKKDKLLMTPGPTMIPPTVLAKLGNQIIHHRTKEFCAILSEFNQNLKYVFQTNNHVITLASSGTGGMESAIANLFSAGDKVIVASIGNFGDRFAKIAEAFGLEVDKISVEWGKAVEPTEIESKLEQDKEGRIKAVIVTHNETSTGVSNDIEAIAKIVSKTNKLFIVDAISSVGGLDIQTDNWGIDVVIGSSQKALMTPPGLAFVSISDKAWEAHKSSKLPKFYWNYSAYKKALELDPPDMPYTPAVSLIIAQNEALKLIKDEGLENVFNRHKGLALAAQAGVEALGMELLPDKSVSSYIITAIKAPEGIDIESVRKIMNTKYDIMVTGGQQHLKGKILRIGHCGFVDGFDLIKAFTALEYALKECGYFFELGRGVSAVERAIADSDK